MNPFSRRRFLQTAALGTTSLVCLPPRPAAAGPSPSTLAPADLPVGAAPPPIPIPHFPTPFHAFVWRNWQLVPTDRLAAVVGARPADVLRAGHAMGLAGPPKITRDLQQRSALTVIRRNWHLLPYEQLLMLLGWTADELAYALREDDFLFIKLGSLKPKCPPLRYLPPDQPTLDREHAIATTVRQVFPEGAGRTEEPLFQFVRDLSRPTPRPQRSASSPPNRFHPRFCSSYFALYGDPLLDADPYPEAYLAKLAASGVDGVWLQAVLYRLAEFPWDPTLSARWPERIKQLTRLVQRARRHGVGVWLYLNEPRAMPLTFHQAHANLKGVVEGDHAALCTSVPEVQEYLRTAIASICRAVPDLAGFFTITASENLTNCWSHHGGQACPRCGRRPPDEVVAEVNRLIAEGIQAAQPPTGVGNRPHPTSRLIAWDWGWADPWAEGVIRRLPAQVAVMSVSEWSIPIERGGIKTTVGEYSISTIGPGPRATRHWDLARQRGLKTLAKIQAGNTWELSSVPYIPAVANVAEHVANLRRAEIDGLMLGWTLGGYPSPNLEVVAELGAKAPNLPTLGPDQAMLRVAERRFGPAVAPAMVQAWQEFSLAFREFPFHGGLVYNAPMQAGPSNLLHAQPTGYRATMVGFPYDDLDGWRQVYPPEVFIQQFTRIADGFDHALERLRQVLGTRPNSTTPAQRRNLEQELSVAEAAAIHFRTTAVQAEFVATRQALARADAQTDTRSLIDALERQLRLEIDLARRLHALQSRDSRLGFESSNQYFYVPVDLVEKVLNCQDLLDRWLPRLRNINR